MNGDLLGSIARLSLDSTSKGAAPENGSVLFADVGKQGWNVLRGDLMFPVLTLHDGHLRTNLRLLRDFAEHHGVSLAPHGKTMMCPQLYRDCIETVGCGGSRQRPCSKRTSWPEAASRTSSSRTKSSARPTCASSCD